MLSVDISCTGDVQDARADNFEESLKKRVRSALDPSLQTSSQETNKDILSSLVRNIVFVLFLISMVFTVDTEH